jgi:ATP-dependent DNA helicase RecQ
MAGPATATHQAEQLGALDQNGGAPDVLIIRGPLARTSLRLGVLRLRDAPSRLAWLISHLGDLPGSGIIYTLTVAAANDTARLLRDHGYEVRAYTGQTDPDEREEAEALLKSNRVNALVATSALGMGFDKPDLGFVIHLGAPSSPVSYYRQVGRAGRVTASADVLLFPGRDIWHYLATASMPDRERAERVFRPCRPRGPAVNAVARGHGRHPSHSAGAAAEGARCRWRGRPCAGRLDRDRSIVDVGRGSLRPDRRGTHR